MNLNFLTRPLGPTEKRAEIGTAFQSTSVDFLSDWKSPDSREFEPPAVVAHHNRSPEGIGCLTKKVHHEFIGSL
jgi:hypothetical protein